MKKILKKLASRIGLWKVPENSRELPSGRKVSNRKYSAHFGKLGNIVGERVGELLFSVFDFAETFANPASRTSGQPLARVLADNR